MQKCEIATWTKANLFTGPKCGFIEKMCTNLRNENIIPAANTPSDNSIGSYGSHSSRGYQGSWPIDTSRYVIVANKTKRKWLNLRQSIYVLLIFIALWSRSNLLGPHTTMWCVGQSMSHKMYSRWNRWYSTGHRYNQRFRSSRGN